jgi:hypothetical protein
VTVGTEVKQQANSSKHNYIERSFNSFLIIYYIATIQRMHSKQKIALTVNMISLSKESQEHNAEGQVI